MGSRTVVSGGGDGVSSGGWQAPAAVGPPPLSPPPSHIAETMVGGRVDVVVVMVVASWCGWWNTRTPDLPCCLSETVARGGGVGAGAGTGEAMSGEVGSEVVIPAISDGDSSRV